MRKLILFTLTTILLLILPNMDAAVKPALGIGQTAPEISLPNQYNQKLTLSSQKGKLVLLSFWSTWCAACNVIKNPEYVRLYNKWKDYKFNNASEFTMYSVAFDSDINKWKRRIKDAGLNWPNHVVDKDTYYSFLWLEYQISSIPSSFLIDEKGKIIGVNMTYDQLNRELEKRNRGKKTGTTSPVPTPPAPTPTPPTPKPTPQPVTPVAPPVATTTTMYKIQLSVLRNPNLAKFKNVTDIGVLETQPISATSSLKRVLLGNFDKAGSRIALSRVRSRGYKDAFLKSFKTNTTTTTPAPAPPPVIVDNGGSGGSSQTTSSILRKNYKIQLGVFRKAYLSKFNALKSIGQLEIERTSSGLERVLLGKYSSRNSANAALASTKQKGYRDAFLVTREEVELVVSTYSPTPYATLTDGADAGHSQEIQVMAAMEFPALKATMVGKQVPKVVLDNQKGVAVPLSAVKNDLVVMYMWASWSGDARENHPDLKKISEKYKGQIGMYSIAFDEKPEMWKKVLKDDQMAWGTQVRDAKGTESPLLNNLNVEYLPALFLIDKSGMVVAENLSYDQLDAELTKRLK